jgi:cytochrome d ubiquinol oxidase subunit I
MNPSMQRRSLLWTVFLCFPLPFIATLIGWFTAEVGRQPWTIYGLLRTADALTPFLTPHAAADSLVLFRAIYVFIFAFGSYYIYKLLKDGPVEGLMQAPPAVSPNRPFSVTVNPSATKK